MENVAFRGIITREQFARVQRLLLPWWAKPQIFAISILYLMVNFGVGWGTAFNKPLAALPDLLEALVIIVLFMVFTAYFNKNSWKKMVELQGEISGQLTESGLDWNTQISNTKLPWNKLLYSKEAENLILIFYSARCAFYFPKQFFASEDAWSAFKQLVTSKIKSK